MITMLTFEGLYSENPNGCFQEIYLGYVTLQDLSFGVKLGA